ncbi:MAG: hypothetical protein Q8P31_05120 [Bacillota bacterium]|nr:hypothetical protein [Bacillota bacterium]
MAPVLQFSVLCDDVGRSGEGKLIIYGVFEAIASTAYPATHRACYVCNRWTGATGPHRERIRIQSPDGRTTVVDGPETSFTLADRTACHTVVCRLEGLTFERPGTYRVQVLLDDQLVIEYGLNVQDPQAGSPSVPGRAPATRPPLHD